MELSESGQPSYIIHQEVAWENLQPTTELLDAMSQASAVCFGTLAQRTEQTRATIHQCLAVTADNTLVVYDVNLRQQWYEREWIEQSLRAADVVKLNDEEQLILAPLLEFGSDSQDDFAKHLRKFGVQTVVLTRGSRGCVVYGDGSRVEIKGEPVEVVDTVGAGDAFTAAFIVGQLRNWPLEPTARLANRVGGLVASRSGAMPDIADEAAALLAEIGPEGT